MLLSKIGISRLARIDRRKNQAASVEIVTPKERPKESDRHAGKNDRQGAQSGIVIE